MIARMLIFNEWTGSPDWSKMRNYDLAGRNKEYSEVDIDNFVEITFRQVSEKLGVKYEDIKDILYGRNIEFFETKARAFCDYDSLDEDDEELLKLKALLKIPELETCEKFGIGRIFLDSFKELDIKEQIDVLDRINRMKIKFPNTVNGFEQNSFFRDFDNLSRQEKYDVLKQLFKAQVSEIFE